MYVHIQKRDGTIGMLMFLHIYCTSSSTFDELLKIKVVEYLCCYYEVKNLAPGQYCLKRLKCVLREAVAPALPPVVLFI
jgi:hypothetical protein